MAIPAVLYVASASQALPIVAVMATRGRPVAAPFMRLTAWCVLLVLADVLDLLVAYNVGTNWFTAYFTLPIEVALTLWLLEYWQHDPKLRRAYLAGIVAVAAGTAISLLLLHNPSVAFDMHVAPVLALVALAATLHTLVIRSIHSQGFLTGADWFWVCLGLALFWLSYVFVPPFVRGFITSELEAVKVLLIVRPCINIAAFVIIAWGVVCPRIQTRSFGLS